MTSENELLRLYAEKQDEAAFAEFVHRHLGLVYATALRLTQGDAALAQEVAQGVFTDLARKALTLTRHPTLAGWLHTSVRFAAANSMRAESTRRVHEQEAATMTETIPDAREVCWEQLRPLLDEAVGQLRDAERDALLLRYFEDQSHREVGAALGVTEGAAQMRVERALEKLRGYFARRGVTTSAALLASTLAARASFSPVPATFAAAVAGKSLAGAANAGAMGGKIAGASSWIFASKTKMTVAAAALLALVAVAAWQFSTPAAAPPPVKPDTVAAGANTPPPTASTVIAPVTPEVAGVGVAGAGIVATTTATAASTAATESAATDAAEQASSPTRSNSSPASTSAQVTVNAANSDAIPADTTVATTTLAPTAEEPKLHEFTDQQGRKMLAEITGTAGANVSIKRDDGTVFNVQKNIFQAADQAYIQQWADAAAAQDWPARVAEARLEGAQADNLKAAILKSSAASAIAPGTRIGLATFGRSAEGELGAGAVSNYARGPALVDTSGVLKDKTIVAIAAGWTHRLALCSDGTLAAWGDNSSGQLGNGKSGGGLYNSTPTLVDTTAMGGKKILAIAARADSSTALCEDGTVYQWGGNGIIFDWGGSHYTVGRAKPTLMEAGALKDKKVVAITGGLALCDDGSVVTWLEGTGNPEIVDATGVLKGKTIAEIADPEMALCTDGAAVTWKARARVGLDQGDKPDAPTTLDRDDPGHLLRGKTITSVAENVVLCTDGSAFLWGKVNLAVGGSHRLTPLTVYTRSNSNIVAYAADPNTTENQGRAGRTSTTQAPAPLLDEITVAAVANADVARPDFAVGSTSAIWVLGTNGTLGQLGIRAPVTPNVRSGNGAVGPGVLQTVGNSAVLRGKKIIALVNGMALFE